MKNPGPRASALAAILSAVSVFGCSGSNGPLDEAAVKKRIMSKPVFNTPMLVYFGKEGPIVGAQTMTIDRLEVRELVGKYELTADRAQCVGIKPDNLDLVVRAIIDAHDRLAFALCSVDGELRIQQPVSGTKSVALVDEQVWMGVGYNSVHKSWTVNPLCFSRP